MRVVSLFSGIGGIEFGLKAQGFTSDFFCEIDPLARAILKKNFPEATVAEDIMSIDRLPEADLVTAGFPCQDLSQAGAKRGISGQKSGLVKKLIALLHDKPARQRPNWILIENVPYMLRLDRGQAMNYLTSELSALGYSWAYRVVDARAFGLPQRRQRVVLLASLIAKPEQIIFSDNYKQPDLDGKPSDDSQAKSFGFYWTEGLRGLGWVREGVPPIKCGSTVGIASPPAIWLPAQDFVGTLDIQDAERLQGFPAGWTDYSQHFPDARLSFRWRLVGNAVSTRVSSWVAEKLTQPAVAEGFQGKPIDHAKAWPLAAYGNKDGAYAADVSQWPSQAKQEILSAFLRHDLKPLSHRATTGFLSRARLCTNIVYSPAFIQSLQRHADRQKP
jgi:DNA (cytosine-5)-methyltransferase 1